MGLFKKIKKAVKKVVKPIKKVVGAAGSAVGLKQPKVKAPQFDQSAMAPQAAQVIEPPDKDSVDTEDESQTESGKKKTRAGGKKSLSVARNSGGGLNI